MQRTSLEPPPLLAYKTRWDAPLGYGSLLCDSWKFAKVSKNRRRPRAGASSSLRIIDESASWPIVPCAREDIDYQRSVISDDVYGDGNKRRGKVCVGNGPGEREREWDDARDRRLPRWD